MSNELPITVITTVPQVHGVIAVTPTYVQPVQVVNNAVPVNVIGEVSIIQPIIVTQVGSVAVTQSGDWTVKLAAEPTIDIGTVNIEKSTTATVVAETVDTTPILLLGTNLNRQGFAVQATNSIVYVKLDVTCSTALYSYELPKKGILEIENYCGPVAAVTASGSTVVMVTEKV